MANSICYILCTMNKDPSSKSQNYEYESASEVPAEFTMTHSEIVRFLINMGLENINPVPRRIGDPYLDRPEPESFNQD